MSLLRTLSILCALLLFVLVLQSSLFAQAPVPAPTTAPAPTAQVPVGGGSVIVRSLWTEIFIVLIMIGLALFAVGRSSNRS